MSNCFHSRDLFAICSRRQWIVDDLRPVALNMGLPVYATNGLYYPHLENYRAPFWWIPTLEAAELQLNRLFLPLISPGPRWLSTLPTSLTQRSIWSGTLRDAKLAPKYGWAKISEAKIPNLEAKWWDKSSDFFETLENRGAPLNTELQISSTLLEIEQEFRFFVVNNEITTGSVYLVGDQTYSYDNPLPANKYQEAATFAQTVATQMAGNQPPAYTLDLALDKERGWLVLEANPIWSSGYYGADLGLFVDALRYSIDHELKYRSWHWRPDPWLLKRLASRFPLPSHPYENRLLTSPAPPFKNNTP